jgi:hypothetical protein
MEIPNCLSIRASLDHHGRAAIVSQLKFCPLGLSPQPFGVVLGPVSA